MKALIYGINYYPELTGIGKYTTEMCEWLVRQGHQVEVITSLPYYPEWRVHESYRGKGWHTEMINGVKVHRGPFYVPAKISGYTRLLHDFSFLLSSTRSWLATMPRNFDVVVCIYPPLPIGVLPLLYNWFRAVPFVFHVQDLQVDAARQLGIIRQQSLLSFLDHFERYFMRRATLVTSISPEMLKKILSKGIPEEKLRLFPNWVDTQALVPLTFEERAALKKEYGYQPEESVVLYSGNLGEKQGLNTLLHAAALAQHQQKKTKFMIVGEGAAKQKLIDLKNTLQLDNVTFAPLVPKKELPRLLNMADLHIILQKKGASGLVMPSKLGSILACGGVPLVAAERDSGLRELIDSQQLGITTDAEDEEALLQGIEGYFQNNNVDAYRKNARYYAESHLCIESVLSSFETTLHGVAGHVVEPEEILSLA